MSGSVGIRHPERDGVTCFCCALAMKGALIGSEAVTVDDPVWSLLICNSCGYSLGWVASHMVEWMADRMRLRLVKS